MTLTKNNDHVKFSLQEGFGAFSYGKSQILNVARYIENQHLHNIKETFIEEYMALLQAFEIEYDEKMDFLQSTFLSFQFHHFNFSGYCILTSVFA
jgi:hypothetical protein